MKRLIALLSIALLALVGSSSAAVAAAPDKVAPVTPATEFHGLPGNNAGFSDQANGACPATAGDQCDGGIHGIATNPGQSGNKPSDRDTPPSCDMHAGIDAANKNCD